MTEVQKYDLIEKFEDVEIRLYHPVVKAEVEINSNYENASSLGFRPLVNYISQNNIAMTAPVLQEQKGKNSWLVSFIMPSDAKKDKLPKPQNSNVSLQQIEQHYAAAISFKGFTTVKKIKEKEEKLKTILKKNNIKYIDPIRVARFDPPWKPGFLRHNEVIIKINYER